MYEPCCFGNLSSSRFSNLWRGPAETPGCGSRISLPYWASPGLLAQALPSLLFWPFSCKLVVKGDWGSFRVSFNLFLASFWTFSLPGCQCHCQYVYATQQASVVTHWCNPFRFEVTSAVGFYLNSVGVFGWRDCRGLELVRGTRLSCSRTC
ncbi:hypothetical protein BDP81DRAFT_12860 [Colletotrichum phormii]|uniref:Uncharacterized protein n=1 Tax=Colletotrichum phormii TaxID=359342 RepID=A0AAJ0A3R5_9PEZI|nr:uncharacterized protein BDP81DRAFT_12860 [Colletotrichum phormii]KAK1655944.1 hypothetical protein BDP81DRAFT_12860 [Colletotrichum phormii]